MNILIIGNGFDLAHGLPTKYTDFLEWVKIIIRLNKSGLIGKESEIVKDYQDNKDVYKGLNDKIRIMVQKNLGDGKYVQINKMIDWIEHNFWIEYFLQCNMYQKENWIDFESEISRVVREFDDDIRDLDINCIAGRRCIRSHFLRDFFVTDKDGQEQKLMESFENETGETHLSLEEQSAKFATYKELHQMDWLPDISYKKIIEQLEVDLDRLILLLELYLTEYVEKMEVKVKSADLESILRKTGKNESGSKVLCFNYTNICEQVYGTTAQMDYIHGKANCDSTINTNNMVLGIDEYLLDDRKDKDIEFITFKKYFQRIHKKTGCMYKEWIDCIKTFNERCPKSPVEHNLYIFGHSLDVTDKDILKELILTDHMHTTIFYNKKYDDDGNDDNGRKSLGEKITNLVKVIGQDELIRRTGGNAKTIEFRLQQDMKEKE